MNPVSSIPAPYGSWISPITAETINRGIPVRDFPCISKDVIYWQESRPEENGRITVVAHYPDGVEVELVPYPFSVRTMVHEYGGKAWILAENSLFFVEHSDQRLYRLNLSDPQTNPVAITPYDKISRYGDLVFDPQQRRILCVREQHLPEVSEPVNTLASINLATATDINSLATVATLANGADFYACPRIDRHGSRLCWISWNHPNMPWDGTELWCADITASGSLINPGKIAGGKTEAIFQPGWSPDGILYFVSDKNGWWNLYRHTNSGNELVLDKRADFATPLWALGMCTWDFLDNSRIAALFTRDGLWKMGIIDTRSKRLNTLELAYTQLASLSCSSGVAVFIAASPTASGDVVQFSTIGVNVISAKSSHSTFYDDYLSIPQAITYDSGSAISHGFFYPPHHPHHRGSDSEKPPLLVMCHGGPTGAANTALSYKIQFWTSRGFAVLDVNYRGSSGFGRAYREALNGQWGLADVADAVAGVQYLAASNSIDPQRVLIRGSSAGGFTALAALTFTRTFCAGASLYGIGDLETLARDTHKFESRYMDRLVGPYPQQCDSYRQRSPVNHIDQLHCPVIFLQGLEDKIVPPRQAEVMVEALRKKKLPVAFITFADEGHGFRKAANIKTAFEAELTFYRRVLNITSEEAAADIVIENL